MFVLAQGLTWHLWGWTTSMRTPAKLSYENACYDQKLLLLPHPSISKPIKQGGKSTSSFSFLTCSHVLLSYTPPLWTGTHWDRFAALGMVRAAWASFMGWLLQGREGRNMEAVINGWRFGFFSNSLWGNTAKLSWRRRYYAPNMGSNWAGSQLEQGGETTPRRQLCLYIPVLSLVCSWSSSAPSP